MESDNSIFHCSFGWIRNCVNKISICGIKWFYNFIKENLVLTCNIIITIKFYFADKINFNTFNGAAYRYNTICINFFTQAVIAISPYNRTSTVKTVNKNCRTILGDRNYIILAFISCSLRKNFKLNIFVCCIKWIGLSYINREDIIFCKLF